MPVEEMNAVADAAAEAFKSWKNTSVLSRQQIMLKYQELIKQHKGEVAKLITREQGKTLPDAEGDCHRGLQGTYTIMSMTTHQ